MGTFVKIIDLSMERLNNAEYTNFLTRYRSLFSKDESGEEDRPVIESVNPLINSTQLGFSKEMVTAFDTDLGLLSDIVNHSRTSDETALLAAENKHRDELLVYFTTMISQTRKSPVAAQKNAATSLYNQVKPYVGIYKLADQQKTQQINGLLIDMEKEPNRTNVTTLVLTTVLDELKVSNQRFVELTAQRTEVRATTTIENSKTVRSRLNNMYEDMILLATSTNILNPTEETESFITFVNALIEETKARYNQRVGIAKANKDKKKPESDRPVIE